MIMIIDPTPPSSELNLPDNFGCIATTPCSLSSAKAKSNRLPIAEQGNGKTLKQRRLVERDGGSEKQGRNDERRMKG